jgi:cell volume regulation protein A
MLTEKILLEISVLLVLSIFSSKASLKLGIPSLLLFLFLGMLAGSEGIGKIYFNDPWTAQFLGIIALVYILFSGGYNTIWSTVKPVFVKGLILSTLGVLLTSFFVGVFAYYILSFSILESLLLGAVVSSTDAAAVFSILRSKKVGLKKRLSPLLEMESASNDPMAVFLTIGLIQMIGKDHLVFWELILMFVQQMSLGLILGYLLGKAMVIGINHLKLEYKGLYSVFTLSSVLFIYGSVTFVGGSGFLAVYIAGLVLSYHDSLHKKSLRQFHAGISWLMQISMFLVLGLLVYPSRLLSVTLIGLMFSLFLMFVARPLSVFLSLPFQGMRFREKLLISWVGLRGAAPIILATFPLTAQIDGANLIFDIVFFIVLTSVLLQGTTITLSAKWLNLQMELKESPQVTLDETSHEDRGHEMQMVELSIPPYSRAVGKEVIELHFPKDILLILITRKDQYIIPSGETKIEEGDKILMLVHKDALKEVEPILS